MSDIFALFKKIEKKESTSPISAIIVGLGNPGDKYAKTRHNVGFMAIDYIAASLGASVNRAKFNSLVGEAVIGEDRVLLMKPETFMTSSGNAVGPAASFYKIPPERVIVIHDEISFDAGLMRIRRKGSAGGHNGLKSIIASLGSDAFPRFKVGVGMKPTPEYDLADWVLSNIPASDMEKISSRFSDIRTAVGLVLDGKIDEAMNRFSK